MFIDREAFILDFQGRQFSGQFCSSALVYAMCSIGASMSPESSDRGDAMMYADTALSSVFSHGLATPHFTTLQALLCCAFYKLGTGNLSEAWLYSGKVVTFGCKVSALLIADRHGYENGSRSWLPS